MVALNLERQVDAIDDETYCSPNDVRREQTLCLILDVFLGIAADCLVEVASLKKEKAHEEE